MSELDVREGWAIKKIEIACGRESDEMYLIAQYCDANDEFDIWFEFNGDSAIAAYEIPESPGRLTTHGGGDYCIDKRTAIQLRDWLLYCFPLKDGK